MTIFDEPTIIISQARGIDGTGMTEPRALQIEANLATMLARPVIEALADIPDVDVTGLADGYVLIWDVAANKWLVGEPPNNTIQLPEGNVESLLFDDGLESAAALGVGVITPVYAGTGVANTIARSDHAHNPVILTGPQTFIATGAISSGTRTLITINVVLLSGVTYDCTARLAVAIRNDGDNGIVDLGLRIGGSASFPKTTIESRNVGGVDVPHHWEFVRSDYNGGAIVGTGATVAVTADITYSSGDPTNVRHGYLAFDAHARR